ncbi:MAG: hypothetical protein D6723_07465 [Acidobacteria bacterium]|nr:MAG: hypothetical protein D6723_07465 [Acidobacteriota bacterium]
MVFKPHSPASQPYDTWRAHFTQSCVRGSSFHKDSAPERPEAGAILSSQRMKRKGVLVDGRSIIFASRMLSRRPPAGAQLKRRSLVSP